MTLNSFAPITVLQICPGKADARISMNFVRHQARDVRSIGVDVKEVFIEDRQSLGGLLEGRKAVRAAIRKYEPDIVHAQYGTVTVLVALASGHWPLVVTFRGSDLNSDGTSSKSKMALKIFMSQLGALFATRVITVSEQLKQRVWWRRERVSVIPSGVDLDRFAPLDRSVARERLGWNACSPIVLFNAGLNPFNKRLDLAEETISLVKKKIPDARLYVMEGRTDPDDVPVIMSASDALLMLSDHEGSPNVVKEALACNLPIVSFDVGDVAVRLSGVAQSEIVPRDTSAVAKSLAKILREGKRSNGYLKTSSFSAESSARKLLALYEQVMRRKHA